MYGEESPSSFSLRQRSMRALQLAVEENTPLHTPTDERVLELLQQLESEPLEGVED